jgi:IS30 family transposase
MPAGRSCCERSTNVGRPLLGGRFNGSLWLGRQLKNRSLLTLTENREQYDLAVRKFDRIVMGGYLFLLICRKIAVL